MSIRKIIKDVLPGNEIVISGISGRYPDTNDVNHFRDNLYNKVDMISDDARRWEHVNPVIPKRAGKLNNVSEFDAGIFGFSQKQTHLTDPMMTLVLENTYEAILDAGYHPSQFKGTKTGVYVGTCLSETEQANFFERFVPQSTAFLGNNRSMLANRISYWLELSGPSFSADTACSSSMYAFDQAYNDLLEDRCDYAIVASSNLCLHPFISLQFALLGVLSYDGKCKTFDNAANGYARSEGIVVFLLEKAKTAKRIYTEIIHSKTNCDGYKQEGITYPSGKVQMNLLIDFYNECGRSPTCHTYLEAHGTGTPVGDPEELNAIDQVCAIGRKTPLYIGSVKSNIGHNEPVSGMCSITKVIIGFENDAIPPNMNFKEIRKGVEGLEKKRMIVVSEKMPWPDNNGLVGVNCFGFGGANSHVLMRWNRKVKVNCGLPNDDLPRLICFSARIDDTMERIFNDLESRNLDAELVALYHNIFKKPFITHNHRGYIIMSKCGTIEKGKTLLDNPKEIAMYFGNISTELPRLLNNLMQFEVIRKVFNSFQYIYNVQQLKFDPEQILKAYEPNNVVHVCIGTIIVQIGLYKMFQMLNVNFSSLHGSFVGVLSLVYAKNLLPLKEVAIISYLTALLFHEHGIGVEYHKMTLAGNDEILSKKLHDFIKQILINKNKGELDSNEQNLIKYMVKNILKDPIKELPISEERVVVKCGSGVTSNHKNVVRIVSEEDEDAVENLLKNLGCLYLMGVDMALDELYPKISFPVSRGTPMIGPLVKLNHTRFWPLATYDINKKLLKEIKTVVINTRQREWHSITGHVIDGRNLVPATGYLFAVWQILSEQMSKPLTKMNITFENVKFLRAINFPKNGQVVLQVAVFAHTRSFEISENGIAIVTGSVKEYDKSEEFEPLIEPEADNSYELSEKDIYKELRLRGYNYNGLFRSMKKCNLNGSKGWIQWQDNWIAFLDNMLQIILLQSDSRNLYVPTGIDRLVINAPKHIKQIDSLGENPLIPITVWKNAGIIRTEGIELCGMNASAINRRKTRAEPVLEHYNFMPNELTLTLKESIRVNVQIMLENHASAKIKAVELIEENVEDNFTLISPLLLEVLGDIPLLQPDVSIYTKKTMKIDNVNVEDKHLNYDTSAYLICGNKLMSSSKLLKAAFIGIKENGYVISRESIEFKPNDYKDDVVILAVHRTEKEMLILFNKKSTNSKYKAIDFNNSSKSFDWMPVLQNALKSEEDVVVLYAQNDDKNGILGFANCLNREVSGNKFRCVFINDKHAPPFDPELDFYKNQLDKGMVINVYQNGSWGTYRHLLLDDNNEIEREWCFVTNTVMGDLNSLKWIETPPKTDDGSFATIQTYYAALNFRDIMVASGRLSLDVVCDNRLEQNCCLGFEFSGTDENGRRVMGMSVTGALSTKVLAVPSLLIEIPDKWSFEDAATVPIVYTTVVYALRKLGQIKRKQSILIHSGAGGIGQAALNVATYFECNIFTTCGTEEKRAFLREHYPHIPDSHIGNSRDISFLTMILKETNGRGVDLVLNSLAEEKLIASVQCLASNGCFLEIGKFDFAVNNPLTLGLLKDGQTFYGVMLDLLFKQQASRIHEIVNLVLEGIADGYVKPIVRTIFKKDDVVSAFRYMTSGKHIGKVLIKLNDGPTPSTIYKCLPRVYCDSKKTSVIIGGLGGFGLELADWLILRGCRKIILSTRNGVVNGYQAFRIRIWKGYRVEVVIAKDDVTTNDGCKSLLRRAQEVGPIEYIFNVAVVLRDKLFENQTVEDFQISLAGKAYATQHLDELTRIMCPDLKNFVVFSSVSCGRGNIGQTNYGMANSIMERICEQRKTDGYPALVVQWGAVGDVGLVAEMLENAIDFVIAGTLQQKITSCLSLLDNFMFQEKTIVASMVVAEKRKWTGDMDIIETVANILGIRDIKTVSPHITLPELGMDSMMGVEVKQTLEREYDIFLAPQDMRTMTFAKLREMLKEKEQSRLKSEPQLDNSMIFFRFIEQEEVAKKHIIKVHPDLKHDENLPNIYLLPGVEGMFASMQILGKHLKGNVYCLQYGYGLVEECIEDIAEAILKNFLECNPDKSRTNFIIAHSFGTIVAVEMVSKLERLGYNFKLYFIDGSPTMMKEMCKKQLPSDDDVHIQLTVLGGLINQVLPLPDVLKHKADLEKCKTYEDKVQFMLNKSTIKVTHSKEYQAKLCVSLYKRIKAVLKYQFKHDQLKSQITLYKPSVATLADATEDFNLNAITTERISIKCFEGNHVTILDNLELADEINNDMSADVLKMSEDVKDLNKITVENLNDRIEAVKP